MIIDELIIDCILFNITMQSLQHAHHSQIFGRRSFDSLCCTIEVEGEAGGKGLADFLRHEHMPLAFCLVAIGQDKIILLEYVVGLAQTAKDLYGIV